MQVTQKQQLEDRGEPEPYRFGWIKRLKGPLQQQTFMMKLTFHIIQKAHQQRVLTTVSHELPPAFISSRRYLLPVTFLAQQHVRIETALA